MAKTLQFRRDTTANLASVTGSVGELFVDTTKKTVVVMDGYTTGGFPVLLANNDTLIAKSIKETRVAMAASNIDLSLANYFTTTITTTTTLTVSNVPATNTAASFILDLTNGGSSTITWWSGVTWAGGTAPTLTSAGRDTLGFFTYDGGTTWTGLVLGKDIK
jgi:hypothetical protein